LDKLLFILLGLEQSLWSQVPIQEKNRYRLVFVCFLIFSILSMISSVYLVYLISSSIVVSLIGGAILTFVIVSTVRFSLIILRKSVFPDSEAIVNPITTVHNTEVIGDRNFLLNLKKNVTHLGRYTSKFLNLGILLKVFILLIMCTVVSFPLVSLFNFQKVENLTQIERLKVEHEFVDQKEMQRKLGMYYFDKRIIDLEVKLTQALKEGRQDQQLYSDMINQKELLKIQQLEYNENFKKEYDLDYIDFQNKNNIQYFIVNIFSSVVNFNGFGFIILFVCLIVFYPHFLLNQLKNSQKYTYSKISTLHFQNQIEAFYKDKQLYLDAYLKEKYTSLYPTLNGVKMYVNPPYCTVKTKFFEERTLMSKNEFKNSVIKQTIE